MIVQPEILWCGIVRLADSLETCVFSPDWPLTNLLRLTFNLWVSSPWLPSVETASLLHHTWFLANLGIEHMSSCMLGTHSTNRVTSSIPAVHSFVCFSISLDTLNVYTSVTWSFQTQIAQTIWSIDTIQNQVILQKCGNGDFCILGLKLTYSVSEMEGVPPTELRSSPLLRMMKKIKTSQTAFITKAGGRAVEQSIPETRQEVRGQAQPAALVGAAQVNLSFCVFANEEVLVSDLVPSAWGGWCLSGVLLWKWINCVHFTDCSLACCTSMCNHLLFLHHHGYCKVLSCFPLSSSVVSKNCFLTTVDHLPNGLHYLW